ncbi:MAG: bacteriophage Gp15 family protein [Treponema sp.]|nr:bacteriophage Gp15 family protein [Treponema sp.]
MISLLKAVLPSSVTVEGKTYKIKTDFQYWLNFSLKCQKGKIHSYSDFDYLYVDDIPENRQKGFNELIKFCNPEKALPRKIGNTNKTILDFEIDSDLIYAAFFEQYNIDLCNVNLHLHWYKFNALFDALHDTKLNEIMSYRAFDEFDKTDYKKAMVKMRQAWELDSKLTEEEKKDLEKFDSLLK